jgi:hypothetical protein
MLPRTGTPGSRAPTAAGNPAAHWCAASPPWRMGALSVTVSRQMDRATTSAAVPACLPAQPHGSENHAGAQSRSEESAGPTRRRTASRTPTYGAGAAARHQAPRWCSASWAEGCRTRRGRGRHHRHLHCCAQTYRSPACAPNHCSPACAARRCTVDPGSCAPSWSSSAPAGWCSSSAGASGASGTTTSATPVLSLGAGARRGRQQQRPQPQAGARARGHAKCTRVPGWSAIPSSRASWSLTANPRRGPQNRRAPSGAWAWAQRSCSSRTSPSGTRASCARVSPDAAAGRGTAAGGAILAGAGGGPEAAVAVAGREAVAAGPAAASTVGGEGVGEAEAGAAQVETVQVGGEGTAGP